MRNPLLFLVWMVLSLLLVVYPGKAFAQAVMLPDNRLLQDGQEFPVVKSRAGNTLFDRKASNLPVQNEPLAFTTTLSPTPTATSAITIQSTARSFYATPTPLTVNPAALSHGQVVSGLA